MSLKYGKRPFVPDERDFKLTDVVDVATVLPKVPVNFGHEVGISDWGMLGNDEYGDCGEAGSLHEHMLWTHEGSTEAKFTTQNALTLYSAVTGFNANDPSTDQGTVIRDLLTYRRKHGAKDAAGKIHKIDGFLSLEPGNLDHLAAAMYVFGAVGIGFNVPSYAQTQFAAGKPWDYEGPGTIEGGHYVPLVARRSGSLRCVTWGKTQQMGLTFYEHFADEAWAIYSKETIGKLGHTPEGFSQAQLNTLLAALG